MEKPTRGEDFPCPRASLLPPQCWCTPSGRACCLKGVSALPEISRVLSRPSRGPRLAAAQGGAGQPSQLLPRAALGKEQVEGCRGGARGGTLRKPRAKGWEHGHCPRPRKLLLTLGKGTGVRSPRAKPGLGGAGGRQWQQGSGPLTAARKFVSSGVKPVPSSRRPRASRLSPHGISKFQHHSHVSLEKGSGRVTVVFDEVNVAAAPANRLVCHPQRKTCTTAL